MALWVPAGCVPKRPKSCENSMPLTLTSSTPETQSITAGMWAAGQPRGYTMDGLAWRGDASASTPTGPQLPWLETQQHPQWLATGHVGQDSRREVEKPKQLPAPPLQPKGQHPLFGPRHPSFSDKSSPCPCSCQLQPCLP